MPRYHIGDACWYITDPFSFLHERITEIEKYDGDVPHLTMSKNHIYSETIVHLVLYFDYGKLMQKGMLYEKTKVVDLNVDESRVEVIALMLLWGYSGWEDFR